MDRLRSFFGVTIQGNARDEPIVIEIPENLYYKELAIYCAHSLIANAISQCEFRPYVDGRFVQNQDYYSLNIKPNRNDSAPFFWSKVIDRMFRAPAGYGAFCFVQAGQLYVADNYNIAERRPFKGNVYDGVVVDDLQLYKTFHDYNSIIFRSEHRNAYTLITGLYEEYGKLIATAADAFKESNGTRYVFQTGSPAGDKTFVENYNKFLRKALQAYVKGNAKIFVEYKGYHLEQMKQETDQKDAGDVTDLIDNIFKMVSKAYKIPESLMTGNITSIDAVVQEFLTFVIDPIADMIGKTLTGQFFTQEEFEAGNYFVVDTSTINHFDILQQADAIDKLKAASMMSTNELRRKFGMDLIPASWADEYTLTKNYDTIREEVSD